MRKKLITGVLSIGILTLVIINTAAGESQFDLKHAGETALDLSKPETLARLTGTWEGQWQAVSPIGAKSKVVMVFAVDPKDEERPIVRQTKRWGAARSDPNKFATSRGKIIEGGKLLFVATEINETITLYEGAGGKLALRGESIGHGTFAGRHLEAELYKSSDQSTPGQAAR